MNGELKLILAVVYRICEVQIISWLKNMKKMYISLVDKPKGRPPAMKKKPKQMDPNDKDTVMKSQADRILELEAEVEALVLQRNRQQTEKKQQSSKN